MSRRCTTALEGYCCPGARLCHGLGSGYPSGARARVIDNVRLDVGNCGFGTKSYATD
jgi:hypothetical protein